MRRAYRKPKLRRLGKLKDISASLTPT